MNVMEDEKEVGVWVAIRNEPGKRPVVFQLADFEIEPEKKGAAIRVAFLTDADQADQAVEDGEHVIYLGVRD